jgi:ribosomal protein S18 acetylase RimI-like enzyme
MLGFVNGSTEGESEGVQVGKGKTAANNGMKRIASLSGHSRLCRHSSRTMMRIRLAHRKELEVLNSIVKDATKSMDEQGIPQWDEIYPNREILSKDIERQEMHVIEAGGRVAGLIVMNEDQSPEYAAVEWMYPGRPLVVHRLTIHPGYQRIGLATRLMDFAEETAAIKRHACIRLDAFTRNPAAFTLYENRGYRKAGVVHFRKGEFFCYEKAIGAGNTKPE